MSKDQEMFEQAMEALREGHRVQVVDNRGLLQTVLFTEDDVHFGFDTLFVKMADRTWRMASACHLEVVKVKK